MIERFTRPSDRLSHALDIAQVIHRGAVRKGTNIPYIEHPLAVALILESHGYPEDLVVAGLLHDTVEDAKYESSDLQAALSRAAKGDRIPAGTDRLVFRAAFLDYLRGEFGGPVYTLVLSVTESKNDGGQPLDWLERKKEQLAKLSQATPDQAALKAADALHNIECTVRDLRRIGLGVLDRFRGGPLTTWHYSATAQLAASRMGPGPLSTQVVDAAVQLSETVRALRPRSRAPMPYPEPTIG